MPQEESGPKASELVAVGVLPVLNMATYKPDQRLVDEALGLDQVQRREAMSGPTFPTTQNRPQGGSC